MSLIQTMTATTDSTNVSGHSLTLQEESVADSWIVIGTMVPGFSGISASLSGLSNAPVLSTGPYWHGANATSLFWIVPLSPEDFGKTITVNYTETSRASVAAAVVTGLTPSWEVINDLSNTTTRILPSVPDQSGDCVVVFTSRFSDAPSPTINIPNPPYVDQVHIGSTNPSGATSSVSIGVGTGSGGQEVTHTGHRSGAIIVSFAPVPAIEEPGLSSAQEWRNGQVTSLEGPFLWDGNSIVLLDDFITT